MYAAKCLTILVILGGLFVLWIFHRKKTNQVMLAIALAILVGGAFRLYESRDDSQTAITVAVILVGLGAIWGASWLSNRRAASRGRQGGRQR